MTTTDHDPQIVQVRERLPRATLFRPGRRASLSLSLAVLIIQICSCASIPKEAVDSKGTIVVRMRSVGRVEIGGESYFTDAARFALRRARANGMVANVEFIIETAALSDKVRRGDPMYHLFAGCSKVEEAAFLLAHDAGFGIPYRMFEGDMHRDSARVETSCSSRSITLEM